MSPWSLVVIAQNEKIAFQTLKQKALYFSYRKALMA
jgi:hypothetical protein